MSDSKGRVKNKTRAILRVPPPSRAAALLRRARPGGRRPWLEALRSVHASDGWSPWRYVVALAFLASATFALARHTSVNDGFKTL